MVVLFLDLQRQRQHYRSIFPVPPFLPEGIALRQVPLVFLKHQAKSSISNYSFYITVVCTGPCPLGVGRDETFCFFLEYQARLLR